VRQSVCPACQLRPIRPGTRRLPDPRFCFHCARAGDQHPADYDLYARGYASQRDRGVVVGELAARGRRIAAGQGAQSRAERLLETLSGIERWVWSLVVKGLSERRIAERLGISRQEVFSWYLQPLRVAAGIPARPRRYRGRGA
jgi:hypothetical protein